jgi:tryptophan synthase beta chain
LVQRSNREAAQHAEPVHLQLLREQLKANPERLDLRLTLIELIYEMRHKDEFRSEALALRALIDPASSQEWKRVLVWAALLGLRDAAFKSPEAKAVPTEPRFRRFGEEGKYRASFDVLAARYEALVSTPKFLNDVDLELTRCIGRPTPLLHAARLSERFGGAQIYIKREDMNQHYHDLMVCVLGQALFAKRIGARKLVVGNSRQHVGAITSATAAYLGMSAVVYMSSDDLRDSASDVFRISLNGAAIEEVHAGGDKPIDVRQPALEHWALNPNECFLVTGLDGAPHPYPIMAWDLNAVVGRECQRQLIGQMKRTPDLLVTRGSAWRDAVTLFPPFLQKSGTRMACVEGPDEPKNPDGARPDYPPVTREHAWLRATGRVEYHHSTAEQALEAVAEFGALLGIIPGIQSGHAIAWACAEAAKMTPDQTVVILLAESPNRDLSAIAAAMGMQQV